MAQNADLIRIEKETRAQFAGEALKKGQDGWCLNVNVPSRGIEKVHRKLVTGEYVFVNSVTDAEKAEWNAKATVEQVNAKVRDQIANGATGTAPSENAVYDKFESSFTLGPYRFSREGWTTSTFGGGDADLPATDWSEDRSTAVHTGRGVYATVSCRITSVYFSFDPSYMSAGVTIYAKIDGEKTTLGTITQLEKRKGFFPTGLTVTAGQEILFGFNYPNNGQRFGYPMALATIRQI